MATIYLEQSNLKKIADGYVYIGKLINSLPGPQKSVLAQEYHFVADPEEYIKGRLLYADGQIDYCSFDSFHEHIINILLYISAYSSAPKRGLFACALGLTKLYPKKAYKHKRAQVFEAFYETPDGLA